MAADIRNARLEDLPEVEDMVSDFVRGHPAENWPRDADTFRRAYFGERPVAQLIVAERESRVVGMGQWRLIYDMFWGMFGAEAEWLSVRRDCRGSGIFAAILARICAQARDAGAEFLHGAGGETAAKLYERVAIGLSSRECFLSGEAFQRFAGLDGLPAREIVKGLPAPELGLEAAAPEG